VLTVSWVEYRMGNTSSRRSLIKRVIWMIKTTNMILITMTSRATITMDRSRRLANIGIQHLQTTEV
jgi:hypothetical protein